MANPRFLQTVKGKVWEKDLAVILPHEHLFTDLRGPSVLDYAQAEPDDVVRVMNPYLKDAYDAGVSALVECSTVGVGRNVAVLKKLAESTSIYIIAPTGVYREAFVPTALRETSVAELADMWVRDLSEGMEGTDIRAGFIKIAMSDDGPTPLEIRNLKAAAQASRETGAVIASHSANGLIARRQLELLEAEGSDLARFIWVHANLETNQGIHLEMAGRGAYIEFDALGADWQDQDAMLDGTLALIEAGFVERILLSHDAGWYQPGNPGGEPDDGMRGFTPLTQEFLPKLRARDVSDDILNMITIANPVRAFAWQT